MSKRNGLMFALSLATPVVFAQYAPPPTAYTVTQNAPMGGTGTMIVYRDGSKAAIDHISAVQKPGDKPTRTRTVYDLQAHTGYSLDVDATAPLCGSQRFSGDWGDPFAGSADLDKEQASAKVTDAGTATIAGMPVKVMEAVIPQQGKAKIWREQKYGLLLKVEFSGPTGPAMTMVDIKQVSFAPPPASVFVVPASCKAAGPPPLTDAERIAAETGGSAADFVIGSTGPASPNSCTILFRAVRAGAMTPITNFQVALDKTVSPDHPGGYTFGVGTDGHLTFSGGGLIELTSQLQNGVLRIDNAPATFDLEAAFGKAGQSGGLMYRHCFGPQTTLLLVLKNPDKLSDGADWLWVKSGKYAAAPGGR